MASFPSSYIPTVAAAATRASDVLTYTAGVSYPIQLWSEFERAVDTGGNESVLYLDDSSTNNRALIRVSSTDQLSSVTTSGGVTQSNVSVSGALAVETTYKGALRVATDSVQLCRDGVLGTEDTSATNPNAPIFLRVGNAPATQPEFAFGYIRRIAVIQGAGTDAQLQSMTGS